MIRKRKMDNTFDFLSRVSIPLGVATSIIGGSAWLTTTHNRVENLSEEVAYLRVELKEEGEKRQHSDSRLARMEGKIDIIIQDIQRRRNLK